MHVRGGTQKFPELLKTNYLKYLYKFETLLPFEVLPLRLDAAIPAPLPMLETLSKIFNRNAVKGHQRFSLKLCNVSKLPTLQILLHSWEPNKLQGAEPTGSQPPKRGGRAQDVRPEARTNNPYSQQSFRQLSVEPQDSCGMVWSIPLPIQ